MPRSSGGTSRLKPGVQLILVTPKSFDNPSALCYTLPKLHTTSTEVPRRPDARGLRACFKSLPQTSEV